MAYVYYNEREMIEKAREVIWSEYFFESSPFFIGKLDGRLNYS